jgi:hypothetical protein
MLKKEMRDEWSTTAPDVRVRKSLFSSSLPFGLSFKRDNNAAPLSRANGRFSEVKAHGEGREFKIPQSRVVAAVVLTPIRLFASVFRIDAQSFRVVKMLCMHDAFRRGASRRGGFGCLCR